MVATPMGYELVISRTLRMHCPQAIGTRPLSFGVIMPYIPHARDITITYYIIAYMALQTRVEPGRSSETDLRTLNCSSLNMF